MTIFRLRSHSRGLGLSPRRHRAPGAGSGPPGDTEAPSVPQNLNATAVSDEQIDLTWDASTDNVAVAGYRIYRDNVLIDTSPTNSYSDTGLASGTEYEYEVSAIDAASNESGRSDPDSATTATSGDSEAPSVPQNLSATAVSDDQIDLTWDASTDNVGVTGYNIYRDDVLTDTSPTNSYSDTGLSPGTYEYEVSAFDAASNESARSEPASAVTPIPRLSPEFVGRGTAGSSSNSANDAGFTYPSEDVQADDLFIALVVVNDRGAAPTIADTASGWTQLHEVTHNELALAVFYKRADGTEAGAVTPFDWGSGDSSNDVAFCQVFQYRYVDWENGGPVVGTPTSQTGDLTTLSMPTVATQGKNGLAVTACAFSDDIGSALADQVSATGGTWIQPRDRDSTTSADDAAVVMYQAPLAEAGTISGGSLSITGSSPVSSRSIAIGFALRGMVDPANYQAISLSVAASADDAREVIATGAVTLTDTALFAISARITGMRFTGLSALAGKTILQANIQCTAANTSGTPNDGVWVIRGEAADAAAQYAAATNNISGRTTTTASRTWNQPIWQSGNRTIRQRSVDVKNVVQEIVARPGFGGVVNFLITSPAAAGRQWAAFDHATLQEPTLTVRYLP